MESGSARSTVNSGPHSQLDLDLKWATIFKENPQRVVDIFDLSSNAVGKRNKWGDTIMDMEHVRFGIQDAIVTPDRRDQWDGLVRADIVGRLCECVDGVRSTFGYRLAPTPPGEPMRYHSTHCEPLWYIAQMCEELGSNRRSTNTIVVSTLRRYWKSMMQRLWDQPGQTNVPLSEMKFERIPVYVIVEAMCENTMDASFISMLQKEDDLTTRLIFRYLMQSTTPDEFHIMPTFIRSVYAGSHTDETFDHALLIKKLFRDIQVGCRGLHRFIEKLECLLQNLDEDPYFCGTTILTLSIFFYHSLLARKCLSRGGPVFAEIFVKKKGIWKSIFQTLSSAREMVLGSSRVEASSSMTELPEAVIQLLSCTLSSTEESMPEELISFIRLLVQAGMFGALDEALVLSTSSTVTFRYIQTILSIISQTVKDNPSLSACLRPELPRPRSLRALLDMAYIGAEKPLPPNSFSRSTLLETAPDTAEASHIRPWLYWDSVSQQCAVYKQCARRGCKRRRKTRCKACKSTEYCGYYCQKEDWSEHRLVCGFTIFQVPEGSCESEPMLNITYPSRFPVAPCGHGEL